MAGTVFNVEPILEFPDRKIHIRLEDTVVVTENGADNLTAAVPADVEPLYALIRQRGMNSVPVGSALGKLGRACQSVPRDRAARPGRHRTQ